MSVLEWTEGLAMYRLGRLFCVSAAFFSLSGCALFESVEAPYLSFSFYVLTYSDTEAVINADINDPNIPDPPALTPLAWRAAVLDAATKAGNEIIHPTQIPAYLLTQLGSDPANHPEFGNPPCSGNATIADTDFEVPGDEVDLGGVILDAPLTSTDYGNLSCNYSLSQQPELLHWSGPQSWPNGETRNPDPFFVTVDGVQWATYNPLHSEVTVSYNASNDRGAGGFWFIAADQSTPNWVNNFDRVLVAPTGGFILEE